MARYIVTSLLALAAATTVLTAEIAAGDASTVPAFAVGAD